MRSPIKIIVTAALSCACVLGLTACDGYFSQKDPEGLTGGVAATVNGVEIPEDDITRYGNNMKARMESSQEDGFAQYLSMFGDTTESFRQKAIDSYVDDELIRQFASERDAVATDEEIQAQIDKMAANYSTEEAWLDACGQTFSDGIDGYRDALFLAITKEKLEDSFYDESVVTDELWSEKAESKATALNDAKHVYELTFDDLEAAEAAAATINEGGALDGMVEVGWDKAADLTSAESSAVADIEETGAAVVDDNGTYKVMVVTETWSAPEEDVTSIDQVDPSIAQAITILIAKDEASDAFEAWLDEKLEASEVVINDMPANLPYYVDMDAYNAEHATDDEAIDDGHDHPEDVADVEVADE